MERNEIIDALIAGTKKAEKLKIYTEIIDIVIDAVKGDSGVLFSEDVGVELIKRIKEKLEI